MGGNGARLAEDGVRRERRGRIVPFDRLRRLDPDAVRVLDLVAGTCKVPALLLLHVSRCTAEVAEARQLAMYLMHVVLQRSYTDIGITFRRDRTTVSHACAAIEDRRDERDFDALVSRLEAALVIDWQEPVQAVRHAS